ncbi:hypothetical protein NB311A_05308 [Nitrobacter sp. Nb-311A]|nr:hypothetical protein NB311A_05308 [Nitrobacter sp. Nb-311A]
MRRAPQSCAADRPRVVFGAPDEFLRRVKFDSPVTLRLDIARYSDI